MIVGLSHRCGGRLLCYNRPSAHSILTKSTCRRRKLRLGEKELAKGPPRTRDWPAWDLNPGPPGPDS